MGTYAERQNNSFLLLLILKGETPQRETKQTSLRYKTSRLLHQPEEARGCEEELPCESDTEWREIPSLARRSATQLASLEM